MKNNYFAIIEDEKTYNNIDSLFSESIKNILLDQIKHIENYQLYKENKDFNIINIVDFIIGKSGNICLINKAAACLSKKDITNLIDVSNKYGLACIKNNNRICAICADIDLILGYMTANNISLDSISNIYYQLMDKGINFKHIKTKNNILLHSESDYIKAFKKIRKRIIKKHIKNSVIIIDKNNTYIDYNVSIDPTCIIYPNNTILGNTKIEKGSTLLPNNYIENANIAKNVKIHNSVLIDCNIGKNTSIGPFAYIRPNTCVGEECRIGDFVELKNSNIGNKTKVSHLTYVGDSDLGSNINLGCGVVFVNYDGMKKQRSCVKDNAFIGCNSNIIAPVTIEEGSYIAAGSTVTENVEKDSLYIARSRSCSKKDWAKNRRDKGLLK